MLAYRYLRPGYKLNLTAQRFDEAEVLQALVDTVRLTSVVSEDGQMMTEMALQVRNNARQYLEITLPPGAEVWCAFVAGQPVRPSRRNGKLLLPMERSSGDVARACRDHLREQRPISCAARVDRNDLPGTGCTPQECALGIVSAARFPVRKF